MTRNIFPETLDGLEIESPAEKFLFQELRNQLSDHFHVFYSIRWLGYRRFRRRPSDGEIDFIIAHPRMGILLIEVKGGIIGFDEKDGFFTKRRDDGSVHSIRDPFEQVIENKYAFKELLETLPNWPGLLPTLGHAVAFPDGSIEIAELGPSARKEIVLLHTNMSDLETWVRKCLVYWRGQTEFNPPRDDGMAALKDYLRKTWLMREPRLGEKLNLQLESVNRLTTEQFHILDSTHLEKRMVIQGCAGSGKTTIAVEKARRLARDGFNTLLTCYNPNLAEHLSRSTGRQPRITVMTFHALCRKYAFDAGLTDTDRWNENAPDFFGMIMPEMLIDAVANLEKEQLFDAIIVDEGQDFMSSWWTPLEMLLYDMQDCYFYIFLDNNQLLYDRDFNLPIKGRPENLTVNCRNSREVFGLVQNYYRSQLQTTSRGPVGGTVNISAYGGFPKDIRAILSEILTRLVYKENIEPGDIVLLSSFGPDKGVLEGIKKAGGFAFVDKETRQKDEIRSTSIRRFKGLESPVIILIYPENETHLEQLLYVATSRAVLHLEIVVHESLQENIIDLLH